MKDELEALAVRVEQADGPSRGLDALIHSFAASETPWIVGHKPGRFPQEPIYGKIADYREWAEKTLDGEPHEGISLADAIAAPAYTASIDAALTLYVEIPERVPSNPRLAAAEGLRQRAAA